MAGDGAGGRVGGGGARGRRGREGVGVGARPRGRGVERAPGRWCEARWLRRRRRASRSEPGGVAPASEAADAAPGSGAPCRCWHARRVPHPARRQARAQWHRCLPPTPCRRSGGAEEKDRFVGCSKWPHLYLHNEYFCWCSFLRGLNLRLTWCSLRPPGCSTVLVPARVVQALNLNLDDLGAQPRYPGGFVLDHGNHLVFAAILFCSVPQMSGGC